MLLTTCPKCQAQFKVSPEQLNVRSGRVMCGRCRHVFNSFESLQRIDSTLGDGPISQQPVPQPATTAPSAFSTDAPMDAPLLEESPTPSAPASSAGIVLNGPPSVPAFLDASLPPRPPGLNTLGPYRNAPLLPREAVREPRSIGWAVLAFLAAAVLLLQITYLWRSTLVSQYPALRPYLERACEHLGCTLPWGRDISTLKVESSDLIEELGTKGRFLLTATIANRAGVVQDYPHIELSLTDTNNQTLARRVLPPDAYLGALPLRANGMAPGASTAINVRIESQLGNAAGYHVELFFP
ncbi:MAG: zinc-ribbon and DUF3426 domain-containing protein [Betaproteobacteria bacterium]|nr:zinc-ribbon and DUF3426 domain-containing protein [Betaproteobacteria bacterium]